MQGYIKLFRSSQESALYFAEPFTRRQARQDLLLIANHKKGHIVVRGNIIEIERGQVGFSEDTLAKRWKRSRGKVRRFLDYLSSKTVQQIEQHKSKVKSVITIKNYDKYQGDSTTDGHQTVQQTDTNKNDKKNKKKEVQKKTSPKIKNNSFKKPKILEIESYMIDEKGIDSTLAKNESEKFRNYYESIGWVVGKNKTKMKSWKGACGGWVKRIGDFDQSGGDRIQNDKIYALYAKQTPHMKKKLDNYIKSLGKERESEDHMKNFISANN